jgi:Fic family protein
MIMHSIEPLLISDSEITGLAQNVFEKAQRIGRSLHPETIKAVAALLRTVNCYYSNLIENHDTHPIDIEKAMKSEYAVNTRERDLQKEARAHIEVQIEIENKLLCEPEINVISKDFLCWLHAEFYTRMPEDFRIVINPQTGRSEKVKPGELRHFNVIVGRHVPPRSGEIEKYLSRLSEVYDPKRHKGANALVALAAAHHRVLWVHPFGDGNGRVTRLMTDAYLMLLGIGGHGLWTASRGLARNREEYLSLLQQADAPRQNNYDERGALSEKALGEFCKFFLNICEDQISYMCTLLDIDTFADRVLSYGRSREIGVLPNSKGHTDRLSRFRPEATRLLHQLAFRGSVPRNEIPQLLGLEERTSRRLVRFLIEDGFVKSQTSRAPIGFSIPAHAAPYIFPGLYGPMKF